MSEPATPSLVQFPAAKQRRIDELLDKNAEGTITLIERTEVQELVAEAERLMVENGQRIRNGVPLFPRSDPTATIDLEIVHKLRDEEV
jgi:hypothetical protein